MIPLTSSTKLDIFIHWFNVEGKPVKNKLILSIRVSLLNPKKISFKYQLKYACAMNEAIKSAATRCIPMYSDTKKGF